MAKLLTKDGSDTWSLLLLIHLEAVVILQKDSLSVQSRKFLKTILCLQHFFVSLLNV